MDIKNFYFKLCVIAIISFQALQAMEYTALVRNETSEGTPQRSFLATHQLSDNNNSFSQQKKFLRIGSQQDSITSQKNDEIQQLQKKINEKKQSKEYGKVGTLLLSYAEKTNSPENILHAAAYYYLETSKPNQDLQKVDQENLNKNVAIAQYIRTSKQSNNWRDQLSLAKKYLYGSTLHDTVVKQSMVSRYLKAERHHNPVFIAQNYNDALKLFERSLQKSNNDSRAIQEIINSFALNVQDVALPLDIKLNYLTTLFNQNNNECIGKAIETKGSLTQWFSKKEQNLEQPYVESDIYKRMALYQTATMFEKNGDLIRAAGFYKEALKPEQEIACLQQAADSGDKIAQVKKACYLLTGYNSIAQNYKDAITTFANVVQKHNNIDSSLVEEFNDCLHKQTVPLQELLRYNASLLAHPDKSLIKLGLENIIKILEQHASEQDQQIIMRSTTFENIMGRIKAKKQKVTIPEPLKLYCERFAEYYKSISEQENSKEEQKIVQTELAAQNAPKMVEQEEENTSEKNAPTKTKKKKKKTKKSTTNVDSSTQIIIQQNEMQELIELLKDPKSMGREEKKEALIRIATEYQQGIEKIQFPETYTEYANIVAEHMIALEMALPARKQFLGEFGYAITCEHIDTLQPDVIQPKIYYFEESDTTRPLYYIKQHEHDNTHPALYYLKGAKAFYNQQYEQATLFLSKPCLQNDPYAQLYKALIACKQQKSSEHDITICSKFLRDSLDNNSSCIAFNNLIETALQHTIETSKSEKVSNAAKIALLKYNNALLTKDPHCAFAKEHILKNIGNVRLIKSKKVLKEIYQSLQGIIDASDNRIKENLLTILANDYLQNPSAVRLDMLNKIVPSAPSDNNSVNQLLSEVYLKAIDTLHDFLKDSGSIVSTNNERLTEYAQRAYIFDRGNNNANFYRGLAMLSSSNFSSHERFRTNVQQYIEEAQSYLDKGDGIYQLMQLGNMYYFKTHFPAGTIELDYNKAITFATKALAKLETMRLSADEKIKLHNKIMFYLGEIYQQQARHGKSDREKKLL